MVSVSLFWRIVMTTVFVWVIICINTLSSARGDYFHTTTLDTHKVYSTESECESDLVKRQSEHFTDEFLACVKTVQGMRGY